MPQREPPPSTGLSVQVYWKYSELVPEANVKEKYWNLLQEVPIINALVVLADISNALTTNTQNPDFYRALLQQFVEPALAARIQQQALKGPAISVVFHRPGNIAVMRNLLLYGTNSGTTTTAPLSILGDLALCANDFVQSDVRSEKVHSNFEITALFVGTWDIHNTRDVAYGLTRMHTILSTLLSRDDNPTITKLRTNTGIAAFTINSLTLPEFIAVVFGLFARGATLARERQGLPLFDPTSFSRELPRIREPLTRFLAARAATPDELVDKLAPNGPRTRDQFLEDLTDPTALPRSLTALRQQPFLRLPSGQILILDLQFVTDLLIVGAYWSLYDQVPSNRREAFRQLWGYLFERYVTDLLRAYYPPSEQCLHTDMPYQFGQIDALLDFGSDVIVIEIKSSLLTEPAKRSGDRIRFAQDIERKFIQTERGKPKAVLQLATAARAIATGALRTTMPPTRIYPVLLADEPACECLGFNAYLNERFQQEITATTRIRPLTVMSIDECEQLLPHVAGKMFSWAELLESRFDADRVRLWSVGQAMYDLRQARNLPLQRNTFLLQRFEQIYRDILRAYQADDAPAPSKNR